MPGNPANNVTSTSSPTFDVSGVMPSIEPGTTGNVSVELLRDGAVVKAITAPKAGGSVMITDPGPVTNGQHTYRVVQVDDANNIGPLSGSLTVTFQPNGPSAPILDPSTDSGTNNHDDITNFNGAKATAPLFDISLVGINAGSTVELLRNGQVVNSAVTQAGPPRSSSPTPTSRSPTAPTTTPWSRSRAASPAAPARRSA